MRPSLALIFLASCASSPTPAHSSTPAPAPAPASTPAPASMPASTPTAATPSPPPPTGGSVLIGDINAPKNFNPKPTLEALSSELVDCYDKARAVTPDLHGKVTLRIQINEAGAVLSVDAQPGGHANDPGLVSCANDVLKADAHFPKPGGMATVLAPLVFRP